MPSPKDTKGPIVKTGPNRGQNRSRNDDGTWHKKRSDAGKSRDKGKKKGCFITTAVCAYRGMPDDCYELQQLRAFRDNHLLKTSEGRVLVDHYYAEAPAIAARLTHPADLEYAWASITHCLQLIDANEHALAIQRYHEMFQKLKSSLPNKER